MSCFYCWEEGQRINEVGTCTECTKQVCVDPSGRADDIFHAEICRCGCDRLVCEPHLRDHAGGHHDGPSHCFPTLGASLAIPAFVDAVDLWEVGDRDRPSSLPRDEETFEDAVAAWNRFLNAVTPGHRALRGHRNAPRRSVTR